MNPARWIAASCIAVLLAAGCRPGPEAARKQIVRAGYQVTGPELVRAASEGNGKVVGLFLTSGDLKLVAEAKDAGGLTPLMAVVQQADADLTARLLAAGVDVNARNAEGWTALMMAASFNDDARCAKLLLDAGADCGFRDANGWSALMQAVYKGNAAIVELLADRSKPDLDRALLVASLSGHHHVARVLLDHGADRHTTTDDGDTPLHLAIRRGHAETAILLLQRGADPGALNKKGENPRRLAARLGNAEVSALVDSAGVRPTNGVAETDWLRKHGIDPAGPDALTGDTDGDGAANRDEFRAGTDPKNPASKPGPIAGARLASYHAEEVPVLLDKVSDGDGSATVRIADGPPVRVKPGDPIPGQPYRVTLARQRRTTDKEGIEVDVSELHLEDSRSGQRVVLVPGLRAKSPSSYAEIPVPGLDTPLRVHQDEVFTAPNGVEQYRVIDLRDEQAVIRRTSDGHVLTLPASPR